MSNKVEIQESPNTSTITLYLQTCLVNSIFTNLFLLRVIKKLFPMKIESHKTVVEKVY